MNCAGSSLIVGELTEPARYVERFAGHPLGVGRCQEYNAGRDILRLANPAEGNNRGEWMESVDEPCGMCTLCFDGPRIDRVDADSSLAEFLRKRARQPVHGRFGCVVNRCPNGRGGADNRAEVDNASAIRPEVVQCFLRSKDQALHIEIEQSVKVLLGDLAEGRDFVDRPALPRIRSGRLE
jgi:hypothetical protein